MQISYSRKSFCAENKKINIACYAAALAYLSASKDGARTPSRIILRELALL